MTRHIKHICIDLDNYTTEKKFRGIIRMSKTRCETFGKIIKSHKTKRGYHIKIELTRKVSFWRSIEIRYYCMDDINRMFYDIMRYRLGAKIIDVCFDQKIYKSKKTRMSRK